MRAPTHAIKRKAAATFLHAVRTAKAQSRPLNTLVTINLWQLGIDPHLAFDLFAKLRNERFQRWSSYKPVGSQSPRNGQPTYAWVFEAPEDRLHLHWMVHIEPGNQIGFRASVRRWVTRLVDVESIDDGIIQIKAIQNAEGLKLYLAKGIDPHLGRLWGIVPHDSGVVYGPRCMTSRNLGPGEWKPRKEAWRRSRRAAA